MGLRALALLRAKRTAARLYIGPVRTAFAQHSPELQRQITGDHRNPVLRWSDLVATAHGTIADAPLVSVVLPTHNRVDLLKRAVESVFRQSATDFELIIVDDASRDGTKAYLASLEMRDPRVRVVHIQTAVGGAGARNAGLQLCRGKWTAFLDDDDQWLPAKLQRQLEKLSANSSAIACSCGYKRCHPSGRSKEILVSSDATMPGLLADSMLGSASLCMCSTRILREIGGFDSTLRSAQDMDLWVRLRQRGEIEVCREVLVLYTDHIGPRISSDMMAQYIGSRRFYFKHRYLMDERLRRRRVAHCCFFMSRQQSRSFRRRCYYLLLSLLNSAPRLSLAFARSSVPRLLWDRIRT
jgi:glycosyltransferase involved in cell wall biosynthesis